MGRAVSNRSKCSIWGVDILILVCVGASEYRFDRLLKNIDQLCDEKVLDGKEIIAQIGNTDYVPRNYKSFPLIGRDEFQKYMEAASFVITHAGTGSVIPPLKLGKKVIVFPRMEKYKEHLDNHQLELSEVFTSAGYTMSAENIDELRNAVKNIDEFEPRTFVSNSERINRMVIDFIESI